MENFNYVRPAKVADAVKAMKKAKDGKYLSGGHTLLPTLKQGLAAPTDIVDLSGLKNAGVKVGAKSVTIGAGTTHAEVAGRKDLKKAIPGLAKLAGGIGHPHVRHRGTIGGSVAHSDPASDLPSVLLALGATFIATSATGERAIPAIDFFTGFLETAIGEDELLTEVRVPRVPGIGWSFQKFTQRAGDWAQYGDQIRLLGQTLAELREAERRQTAPR